MTTDAFDRRTLLGLGAAALAFPRAALAQPRGPRDMLIVNALGGFSNPNDSGNEGETPRRLPPRLLADAHASGMDSVNVTLGYVAGEMEPFEYSVREIGRWNAILRAHPADLLQVRTAADILRARRERRIGV